jgi:hypothetical protein
MHYSRQQKQQKVQFQHLSTDINAMIELGRPTTDSSDCTKEVTGRYKNNWVDALKHVAQMVPARRIVSTCCSMSHNRPQGLQAHAHLTYTQLSRECTTFNRCAYRESCRDAASLANTTAQLGQIQTTFSHSTHTPSLLTSTTCMHTRHQHMHNGNSTQQRHHATAGAGDCLLLHSRPLRALSALPHTHKAH